MPRYVVYDKEDGQIVHLHETYDAVSGTTIRCTREEVLAVVDERLDRAKLDVLETEFEPQPGSAALRVDLDTRGLVTGE